MKPKKKNKCPTCKKMLIDSVSLQKNGFFPFCCAQCKMSDLYGWFNEEYSISRELSSEETEDNNKE
ncbi:DNA gyrase inhibitor YacG [Chlamydiota bacterium]